MGQCFSNRVLYSQASACKVCKGISLWGKQKFCLTCEMVSLQSFLLANSCLVCIYSPIKSILSQISASPQSNLQLGVKADWHHQQCILGLGAEICIKENGIVIVKVAGVVMFAHSSCISFPLVSKDFLLVMS